MLAVTYHSVTFAEFAVAKTNSTIFFFNLLYAGMNIVPYFGEKNTNYMCLKTQHRRKILDSQKGRINQNVTPGSSKK